MADDDVLREVRAAREAFARAHGFDPHAMVAALRKLDAADDRPVLPVTRPNTGPAVSGEAALIPPHQQADA